MPRKPSALIEKEGHISIDTDDALAFASAILEQLILYPNELCVSIKLVTSIKNHSAKLKVGGEGRRKISFERDYKCKVWKDGDYV